MEETTSEQQVPSEISFVQSLEFNDRCLSDWQIHALLEHGAIPAELDVHKTAVGRLEGVGRDPKQPDNKDLDLDNKDLEDKGLDLACRTINRGSRGIGLRKKSPGATRRQETSQPAPGHCKGDSRETAIKEGAEDIVAAGRGWGCHTWDRLLRQLESEGRLPFRVDVEGLGPKTVDRQSCLAALDFRGDGLPYPPYEIQVLWEEMGAGYPSAASFLYTVPYKFNRYIDLYFYWHYLYDAGMPCSFYTWLRLEDAEPQTPVKRTSIVSPSLLSKEQLSTARAIYRKTYGQIKPLFAIHVWEAFNLLGESAEEAVGKRPGKQPGVVREICPTFEMDRRIRRLTMSFCATAQFIDQRRASSGDSRRGVGRGKGEGLGEALNHALLSCNVIFRLWELVWNSWDVVHRFQPDEIRAAAARLVPADMDRNEWAGELGQRKLSQLFS